MISALRLQSMDFSQIYYFVLILVMLTARSTSYSVSRSALQTRFSWTSASRQLYQNKFSHKRSASALDAEGGRDKSPFFISTPIYYVNGQPHLGHAYTSVVSDVIARFQRADGREVYFLTGTDEHGQKVEQSALAAGKTPLEFADEVSSQFKHLVEVLDCSHDDFIRTTEVRHKAAVEKLWEKLTENGQIYLGAYEGW
jgi:leucyl-tRNA synthetase